MVNSSSPSREHCDSAESIHSFIHKANTPDLSLTIIPSDRTTPPSRSRWSSRLSLHPRNGMAQSTHKDQRRIHREHPYAHLRLCLKKRDNYENFC
jgi:hypothetical protein